jgi:hypothetical protein
MTETVIAVFDGASAAEAALPDLEVARIPSAGIRRETRNDPKPVVTVTVDEMHADAVTGILNQHGPLHLEEHVEGRR